MRHLGLIAFMMSVLCAQPAAPADADHGLSIAKRWCAECHVVGEGQSRAKTDVLPFATIATLKTTKELTVFLTDPHPKMPDMALSRLEIADIIAYIKTLGQAPGDTPAPSEPKPLNTPAPG